MPTINKSLMPLAETGRAPYISDQVLANLREFLNQLDSDPEWVRHQCESILSRGIAEPAAKPPQLAGAADTAFRWLKLERERIHGSMRTWREETLETFHRDLGLLIDFATREEAR